MKTSHRSRISTQTLFLVLILGLVTLTIISAASIALVDRWRSDSDIVSRALDVTNKTANLRVLLRRAESGQRGYLLTNDVSYLDIYRSAAERIQPTLDDLTRATADIPVQQKLLVALQPLIKRRTDELGEAVRL